MLPCTPQQLQPEYEKLATALKGIASVGAVDCDQHKSLPGQHGVKGFPTLKLFYNDGGKVKSTDYQGGRTAKEMLTFLMDKAKALGLKRLGEKAGGSSGGASGGKKAGGGGGGGGAPDSFYSGTDVVTLDDSNFDDEVKNSGDLVLVEVRRVWPSAIVEIHPPLHHSYPALAALMFFLLPPRCRGPLPPDAVLRSLVRPLQEPQASVDRLGHAAQGQGQDRGHRLVRGPESALGWWGTGGSVRWKGRQPQHRPTSTNHNPLTPCYLSSLSPPLSTAAQSTCSQYGVQGYPTIKFFGKNKNSPSDYQGGRDSGSIVSFATQQWSVSQMMRAAVEKREKGNSLEGFHARTKCSPSLANSPFSAQRRHPLDPSALTTPNPQPQTLPSPRRPGPRWPPLPRSGSSSTSTSSRRSAWATPRRAWRPSSCASSPSCRTCSTPRPRAATGT
jgi:hypothetical protein